MSQINQFEEWIENEASNQSKINKLSSTTSFDLNFFDIPFDKFFLCNEIPEEGKTQSSKEIALENLTLESLLKNGRGLTCRTCNLLFSDSKEQQSHFKTEFHVLNVKRKFRNESTLSFEEYQNSNAKTSEDAGSDNSDQEAAIEGSSSSSGEEEEFELNDQDIQEDINRYCYEDSKGKITKRFSNITGPVFTIQSNILSHWNILLHSSLFRTDSIFSGKQWYLSSDTNIWSDLKRNISQVRSQSYVAVFILRSGKFAAAIFDPKNKSNELVIHKVVKRYTVRAKAGGGQSSHDKKSSKANSMGAQLRRYGEKALEEDIQRILTTWQDYLDNCGLIHIVTTKSMRSTLFEKSDGASNSKSHFVLLKKDDPRIVNVPFIVEKVTLESAVRVYKQVIQVQFKQRPLEAPKSILKTPSKQLSIVPVVSEIPESFSKPIPNSPGLPECHLAKEINRLCQKGNDLESFRALKVLAKLYKINSNTDEDDEDDIDEEEKESLSSEAQNFQINNRDPIWDLEAILNMPGTIEDFMCPLHHAAQQNMPKTVTLLMKLGANPEQLDVREKPPYFYASSKETRDAFRWARGLLGEQSWQWAKTMIPEALTNDVLAQQKQKEKEKKKRAQQRKKEKKAKEEQEKQDALLAKQLQEEMERQAQEEYERKLKESVGQCDFCNSPLYRQNIFEVFDKRCCSTDCIAKLRRKLAADAALARMGK